MEWYFVVLTARSILQAVCLVPHKATSPVSSLNCCGLFDCYFVVAFRIVTLCSEHCCMDIVSTTFILLCCGAAGSPFVLD